MILRKKLALLSMEEREAGLGTLSEELCRMGKSEPRDIGRKGEVLYTTAPGGLIST
jgi:hypothetical protein